MKRQKNNTSDAEAICEAASRPTMRFVAVKSETQQALGMLFRTRDLLVRQRTQTVNALRGHFTEFGIIAPQGLVNTSRLAAALGDPVTELPAVVRELGGVLLEQIAELNEKITELERQLHAGAYADEEVRRLMSIPGLGPITALAILAFAPPGSWLARMLACKPRMLVAVALANRMARIAWALMTKGQLYREPAPVA